jgi:hypothetical protein
MWYCDSILLQSTQRLSTLQLHTKVKESFTAALLHPSLGGHDALSTVACNTLPNADLEKPIA